MAVSETRATPVVAVVLPCFNEEEALPGTLSVLSALFQRLEDEGEIAPGSFLFCVDDGSTDNTWNVIASLHASDLRVHGLKLAGNAGHQNALVAGMLAVKNDVDCAITMDADLQDDVNAIARMLEAYREGDHIVYGVRHKRSVDSRFKRVTASMFYSLLKYTGTPMIPGHADFRLMSRLVLENLERYREGGLFLRTLFPSMKLRSSCVYYPRKERLAGVTKYPLRKMLAFAVQGLTSSSPFPLRIAAFFGLLTLILALLQSGFALAAYLSGHTVTGWTSLILEHFNFQIVYIHTT